MDGARLTPLEMLRRLVAFDTTSVSTAFFESFAAIVMIRP